ncbi:hypothetical protein CL648_02490 [bacterium]|nr:hypothetical protein [bacterium]|tara:strand:+ start:4152 stop:5486 length:1335 start_codon:yes stop_codon:yes gene_type:complete
MNWWQPTPIQILVLGYVVMIAIGSCLLMLPVALMAPIPYIDALFTATSALCVTGLVVNDVSVVFSRVGQCIILAMIQLGGLGIMSLSAFVALLLKKKLSQQQVVFFQSGVDDQNQANVLKIIRAIVGVTIAVEGAGAVLLFLHWYGQGFGFSKSLFYGVFHAVSAFCNAGFTLFSDSLYNYIDHGFLLLVIAALVTLGGLGFPVLYNVIQVVKAKFISGRVARITPNSKLVLWTSFWLIIGAASVIFIAEYQHAFQALPWPDQVINAVFYSISARTAGFSTMDLTLFHPAVLLLLMGLMYVGTAPGSTGGGIRITTMVVMLGNLVQVVRGHEHLNLFYRRVSMRTYRYALSIAMLSILIVGTFLSAMISTQASEWLPTTFEVVSAFGTAGLSMGLTDALSILGKFFIIVLMMIGRVGALSFLLVFSGRRKTASVAYPEEHISVV